MYCLIGLQVVKNVASQSLEVKKLVYLYLLHYAERQVVYILYLSLEANLVFRSILAYNNLQKHIQVSHTTTFFLI